MTELQLETVSSQTALSKMSLSDRVFYYFEEISKIPRGSGNTKEISDYCVEFARKKGFFVRQDEWNNVVIRKPASYGREKEAGIIIQGHLDMVAEKLPDSPHDFLKDSIELITEGDFLTAKDTTLGADDGIAVAMGLALLEDDKLSHPCLEVIFTSDEETGMDGAMNLDMSDITGKYVLNLDSETEGILTAGCAGGAKVKTVLPLARTEYRGLCCGIVITGLKGGHSGAEIDKERANADILMIRLLRMLYKEEGIRLFSLSGGGKDNAIPRECRCQIILDSGHFDKIKEKISCFEELIRKEYASSDSDISVQMIKEEEGIFQILDEQSLKKVLFYFYNIPNGVIFMNQDIKGLVETSLNLGILTVNSHKAECYISVRSSVASRKKLLLEKLADMAEQVGAKMSVTGEYPEWSFRRESKLRETMIKLYYEMYAEELKVDVIHAGLECGYLLQKKPELDIISFGPQMYDIHTTEERLSISSTNKIYAFVKRLIETGIKE